MTPTTGRDRAKSGNADRELAAIAAFVAGGGSPTPEAFEHARWCFLDAMAGALFALRRPACAKQLGGPAPRGRTAARVLGTAHLIDLEKAAHDTSLIVRWLDVDDGWLTVERGHAADGVGAILPVADFASRARRASRELPLTMRDVLAAMIDAHEIQRALAENEFDRTEVHHLVLTRIGATAVSARLLGADEAQIGGAIAHAWADGQATFATRPERDAAVRMAQAAGDAASRATRAVLRALRREAVPEAARSAARWGLYEVLCQSGRLRLKRDPSRYAIEDVVPKLGMTAEYEALVAAECAIALGPEVRKRLGEVARIEVATHEPAIRHLSRGGALHGTGERRRSLEYVVAAALLRGELTPEAYEDATAGDPRLEALRERVAVVEDPRLTGEYFDPVRRGLGASLRITFTGGGRPAQVGFAHPTGHRTRRADGAPLLERRVREALAASRPPERVDAIWARCSDQGAFEHTPVDAFMDLLAP